MYLSACAGLYSSVRMFNICRPLFRSDLRFFRQHDRNVIAHRINPPAGLTLQAQVVRRKFDGRFADRTNQNLQQLLRNSHRPLHSHRQSAVCMRTVTVSKRLQHEQPATSSDCKPIAINSYLTRPRSWLSPAQSGICFHLSYLVSHLR